MIIPGKHGDLFERNYLEVYGRFDEPLPNAEAEALVVMMKYLSERLRGVRIVLRFCYYAQ